MKERLWQVGFMVSVVVLMSLFFRVATSAQKAPEKTALEIKDTKQFFDWFRSMRPAKRTEFETEEDYKKRVPVPFDSNKVIYFRANCRNGEKCYTYDISNEKLTVFGGAKLSFATRERKGLGEGIPISIAVVCEDGDSYTATNAYGASVLVERKYFFDYVLNLLNLDTPPDDFFDSSEKRFRITVSLPPKEAERLSKTLEIILGVTLPGYECSLYQIVSRKEPTITWPMKLVFAENVIDANLVKVLLRDSASGRVLLERDVPQN